MGTQEQLVFGLDIGTRSIVGTVGYKKTVNDFTVVAHSVRMHESRAMLDGQIHDIGRVAETIKDVKRDLEKQLNGQKLTEVCIAAAGRVLKTITVKVEEDFNDEATVDDEAIRELELKGVEAAYARIKEETLGDGNNYYCVAYTVVHYYLNDFVISNLADHKAKKIGAEILATFLPDEVIEGLYTAVDKAGLKVANLTLEPIAAIMVAIPEKFRLLNIALVDVGAGTSDISITKDGSIIAYGMIPMAGDALTEVITQNHLCDFQTAENIKLESSTKKKSIVYKDIMGLSQKTTPAEIKTELTEKINEMTERTAKEIIRLNGGKAVSAVFVVGGGGKHPLYVELLAKHLGIAKERVALRGEEVLGFVKFPSEDIKKDPMLVTPVGICLNYYEKKNNFVFVTFNGDSIKLYDNNRLTVMDAALTAGFPNENLFPKRGKALGFTLNGQARMQRGEAGEAAQIKINGKEASANSPIAANDEIVIVSSTMGAEASLEVKKLPEYKAEIVFTVNNKSVICPKFIKANGELVSGFYNIKEGDALEIINYYTLQQILDFMDIEFHDSMLVNNEPANRDTKVYENFKVDCDFHEHKASEITAESIAESIRHNDNSEKASINEAINDFDKNEVHEPLNAVHDIHVMVNGTSVVLKGKTDYRFVDVLDVYPFDLKNPQGTSVKMTINGQASQFIDTLKDGDKTELAWIK